jgi:hypothetical protein
MMTHDAAQQHQLVRSCLVARLRPLLSTRVYNLIDQVPDGATVGAIADLAVSGTLAKMRGFGEQAQAELVLVLGRAGLHQECAGMNPSRTDPDRLDQIMTELARLQQKVDVLLKIARPE